MSELRPYKSYSFAVERKDPIINRVRVLIQDQHATYKKINQESGVSTTTLYNWFRGKTRRPQFCTVMAVFRALGHDLQVAPYRPGHRTSNIRTPRLKVVASSRG